MKKLGFYFNMDACIGCRTCQIACKDKNNLEVGALYRKVESYEAGKFPQPKYYHFSRTCNHCENPACMAACPTDSYSVAADGTVQHNMLTCIGCLSCKDACPYDVPQFFEEIEKVHKCDFCKDLIDQGQSPACVDACLQRCLEWGDLDELKKKYGSGSVSELPVTAPADMTGPSALIKPKAGALDTKPVRVEI